MRLMLKKLIVSFLLYITNHLCLSNEFIYPVAQVDDQNVFVVHQKAIDELELFLWNPQSKFATKELSTMFLPSHIKMLPSKIGFSFIDRGRIRIKLFQKRAPKTIDILEPIDSIVSLNWITDNQFYLVGKHKQHYKTFLFELLDFSYQIYHVNNVDSMDYIYPYKTEDLLFCISKNEDLDYFLIEQLWYPTKYALYRPNQPQKIIIKSKEPLCFLHMKNKEEGFFLRCNPSTNDLLSFTCCNIIKKDGLWTETKLFNFQLPIKYLMGDSSQRVYESIYPFLPNYNHEHKVYFVDYDQSSEMPLIYTYDYSEKTIAQINFPTRSFLKNKGAFAPIVLQQSLCYGLILSSKKSIRSILDMNQENGFLSMDLPFFHIN